MIRRTKQEALETRDRIVDTAEQVFSEKGVARTSLGDIATAAGVTRGAIYWHFKNKSDLFEAMLERILLPFSELVAPAQDANDPDPLRHLHLSFVACLRETGRLPQRRRVLNILMNKCEHTDDIAPFVARLASTMQDSRERIQLALRNAAAKQQLPATLDTRLAAAVLHAQLGGLLREWLLAPHIYDIIGDADRVVEAMLDMVRYSAALRAGAAAPESPAVDEATR
jgi:TetR/AcrR family acrAB operon transcriptional repressor